MKFLLTSGGVRNPTIQTALVGLLGRPIAEASALCIPTAAHAMRSGGPGYAYRLIRGSATPMTELGWKSVGVLELTALPSIRRELWAPLLQETDALLVGGGSSRYLAYWMRASGLSELLPGLRKETVYVGVSGGSMAVTPTVGDWDDGELPVGTDKMLSLVDFAVGPHLVETAAEPGNSRADLEEWAAKLPVSAYIMDDQTAIKVDGGPAEVVSEGKWKLITH